MPLRKSRITAPVAGIVGKIEVSRGELVGTNSVVATIENPQALRIDTGISIADYQYVGVGAGAIIDDTYEGQVVRIGQTLDARRGKIAVEVLPQETANVSLVAGQVVSVAIDADLDTSGVFLVPIESVAMGLDGASVFIIEEGVVTQRNVEIDNLFGAFVEVSGGLEAQDLLAQNAREVVEGQEVRVVTNQ